MRLPSQLSAIAALLLALAMPGEVVSAPLAQTAKAKSKQATAIGASADFEPRPADPATLNVKAYGAVGNGEADDTAAIQRALDRGGGKQVFVPAGTYKVRPLWERTSTTLRLDPGAKLLLAPGSNANLITVTANGASVVGRGILDGNRVGQTQGAAISVGGANGVTVRDARVVNTARSGIYAANAANLTVSGVSVSGAGYGGIFVEATTGQLSNVVIENSRVDRSSESTSIVEGGIVVHRTGDAVSVSAVRISGNTVTMPKGPWGETVAIETFGGVKGAVIKGNTTNGAFIGISVADTTSASVTGNRVSSATAYGIELADSRQTTVSGNTVSCAGLTPEGIVLDNISPTDNTISDNNVTGCVARGISLNEGSDRARIAGNQISQGAGYAIEVISSAGVTVTNNVLDGRGTAQKALVGESSPDIKVSSNRASRFTLERHAPLPVGPSLDREEHDQPERRRRHPLDEHERCNADGQHRGRCQDHTGRAPHRHFVERRGDGERLQRLHPARCPALRRFADRCWT